VDSSRRFAVLAALIAAALAVLPLGSAAAAGCPNEALRVGPSSGLPDCRAYERVSFQDTNGIGALVGTGGFVHVLDDDRVLWGRGVTPVVESRSGANPTFLATRTPSGWVNRSLLPADGPTDVAYGLLEGNDALTASVWQAAYPTVLGSPPPASNRPPVLLFRDAAGNFEQIAEAADSVTSVGGMSVDGGTVVYSSTAVPAGLPEAGGLLKAYAWSPGGAVRRLADEPGGPLVECATDYAGGNLGYQMPFGFEGTTTNNVSLDGGTTFLVGGSGGAACPATPQLYVDRAGVTREISRPTDGTPVAPGTEAVATFVGASPVGGEAFFVTATPLAADDEDTEADLYRWRDATGSAPESVACITCGGAEPRRVGRVFASPTASHLYFTADGVIDGEGTPGARSLFAFYEGAVHRVTGAGTSVEEPAPASPMGISADGSKVVFTRAGTVYRALLGPAGAAVDCVSCYADGTPGPGSLEMPGKNLAGDLVLGSERRPASLGRIAGFGSGSISEDGRTVVFYSPATPGFAPGGTEGDKRAYRWTEGQGIAYLGQVGPGISAEGAAITPSGRSIFLAAAERLTTDTLQEAVTLYDARVEGGFPFATSAAPCVGEACQGAPGAPGPSSAPASSAFHGLGNLAPGCPAGTVRRSKGKGAPRCVKKAKAKKHKRAKHRHGKRRTREAGRHAAAGRGR
jgi:hypothetical protein